MKRAEILSTLVTLGRKTFDEDDFSLEESTPFINVDAWDSLSHMHMVVAMERAFAIKFDLAELKRLVYVRDLVDIIERKTATP